MHIPDQTLKKKAFWRDKKARIFSAGSVACIVLAGVVFWHFVPAWAAQPVILNPIPDQNAITNMAFNFQFAADTFYDPEHTLTYTAELAGGGALPAWLNFDAATRTFSGTPTNSDVGTVSIDVTADDGNGGTVTDTFTITVNDTNSVPTIVNPIPDRTAPTNNIFNFQFAYNTFNDDDGDSLTYSAQLTGGGALPAWLEFNGSWRVFSGTPSSSDIGTISINVTADDGNGGTATETFTIEVVAAPAYSGTGDGLSEESAYAITNCEQLQEMSNNLGAWYRLANSIDCSDTVNWNDGAGFAPIGSPDTSFLGTLDGAGYTISGLTIKRPNTDYIGLFGYIGAFISDGAVRQFLLEDVSIQGKNYVGGVVGESWASVSEIGVTGTVHGVHVVGGVAGNNSSGISNVYSHAAITGVTGSEVGGGLVGQNAGFVNRSYSTGIVPVGTGKGGLIGDDFGSGGVLNSFWDTETSGNNVSDEGIGKTTAEMKNVATFTNTETTGLWSAWDFVGNPNDDTANDNIWDIDPLVNQGYPYLAFSATPDTTITNPSVNPIHSGTIQTNHGRDATAIRRTTPVSTRDVTIDNTTPESDNPNSVSQTDHFDSSNDTIKKSETTDTNFIQWVIRFLSIILIVNAGFIYKRTHRDNTK
jgi:hypothetical protein